MEQSVVKSEHFESLALSGMSSYKAYENLEIIDALFMNDQQMEEEGK